MKKVNVDNLTPANLVSRIIAAAVDFGLAALLSVFCSSLGYMIAQKNNPELNTSITLETKHVHSSHLVSKNSSGNYVSFVESQYFEKTSSGGYQIIDSLAYYYVVYLAGDSNKAVEGELVSPVAEVETVIDGVTTTPKDYYSVQWFNENVLGLPKAGEEATNDYFEYKKNELNEIDYSSIGTVAEKYLTTETIDGEEITSVTPSKEMITFVYNAYKKAATNLYDQTYMKGYVATQENMSKIISLITRLIFYFIMFELMPLLLKNGKTLGKLMVKISLANFDGDPIKKWQVLPRGLIILLLPIFMYFVPNLFIQIGVIGALLLISIIMLIINKNTKLVLHDYIARTVVVDDLGK